MNLKDTKTKTKIKPLAFGVYFWPFALLSFAGLLVSFYLAVSHYLVYTDIGYESFCAISRAINCDTVSQSPYSIQWNLPVPIWGVIGYLFILLLLIFVRKTQNGDKRMWSLLLVITLFYSGYSVFLAVVSHVYISSYCLMCIISYAINFLLLFYTWLIRRRFDGDNYLISLKYDLYFLKAHWRSALSVFLPFAFTVGFLWYVYPPYWLYQPVEISDKLHTGTTPEGHQWIGSDNAELVITEYTDYMCFQCKKIHQYLRRLMNQYPGKIKLIHRHFPMDSKYNPIVKKPFHEGAGKLSLMAIQAGKIGKFWPINDELYARAGKSNIINVNSIAEKLEINPDNLIRSFGDEYNLKRLNRDIIDGLNAKIPGTPSFVIDGNLYVSQIPVEILERIK